MKIKTSMFKLWTHFHFSIDEQTPETVLEMLQRNFNRTYHGSRSVFLDFKLSFEKWSCNRIWLINLSSQIGLFMSYVSLWISGHPLDFSHMLLGSLDNKPGTLKATPGSSRCVIVNLTMNIDELGHVRLVI